jgi:hypothetical protein
VMGMVCVDGRCSEWMMIFKVLAYIQARCMTMSTLLNLQALSFSSIHIRGAQDKAC